MSATQTELKTTKMSAKLTKIQEKNSKNPEPLKSKTELLKPINEILESKHELFKPRNELLVPTHELLESSNEPLDLKVEPRKYDIVWLNVIVFTYYHLAGIYGLYLGATRAMWSTIIYTVFLYWLSAVGVTAGAHRLWSHKSYKASGWLQVFLMLSHSLANQHSVVHWARDHRLHHKYADTDADPHNARRGLFYSHVGWLFVRKHPEVIEKGKGVDLSDLTGNPVLSFQHRHASWFILTVAFVIPSLIPYYWNEAIMVSYHLNMLRYIICLNATFLINSASHKFGYKPYDKTIVASQSNLVSMMTLGEGFHNYHHVFPYDYRASELGNYLFNYITVFIDFCAYFGLVYDRKMAPQSMVEARKKRTGDGRDLWCRLPKELAM